MPNASVTSFRQLHLPGAPLLLPNAWDVVSARLFEAAGARAIATTSAGVAWALGYTDGRALPMDEAIAAAARIMRLVQVPLSIDIENGYSDDPQAVGALAVHLARIGVAGINIEDGRDAPALLAAKIAAIRAALAAADEDLFVNARSDVFLAGLVEPSARVGETLQRAALYASAGADGLFVPGLCAHSEIQQIVAATNLPLNLMTWPGLPDAAELASLGVRRLSAGSAIAQHAAGSSQAVARAFLDTGASDVLLAAAKPFAEVQQLFPAV